MTSRRDKSVLRNEPRRGLRNEPNPIFDLILEVKGFDPLEDVKRNAAERWVAAVNADGSYGRWAYVIVRKPEDVPACIGEVR